MTRVEEKVLLLTVGTGTKDQIEQTILGPFGKTLKTGEWTRVVLLPSRLTFGNAELVRKAHPELPIEIRQLSREGEEEDIDACFTHFDGVITELVGSGCGCGNVAVDFTRGTKAMSAALTMAALSHGVRSFRYLGAEERNGAGAALASRELVKDVEPAAIFERRDIELARNLLDAGDFAAVGRIFPGGPQAKRRGPRREEIAYAVWAADFWGAWDNFDYKRAAAIGEKAPAPAADWCNKFGPTQEHRKFLASLRKTIPERMKPEMADACRDMAADLMANAERRLAQGLTEEVLVRLYRVLELIGQYRLLERGYDSGAVRCDAEAIAAWVKQQNVATGRNSDGTLKLGREQSARLLEHLGDELAAELLDLRWVGALTPTVRNRSILIHGFRAKTAGRGNDLRTSFNRIRAFFTKERPENLARLEAARFPFWQPA